MNPGVYTVKAEATGFQALEHTGVQVEVSQNIRVDLTLQPGAQTQTVTVTSEAPAIDTSDSTLGGTVSNASMLALPLNGRNFQRLIDLHPGVVIVYGGMRVRAMVTIPTAGSRGTTFIGWKVSPQSPRPPANPAS